MRHQFSETKVGTRSVRQQSARLLTHLTAVVLLAIAATGFMPTTTHAQSIHPAAPGAEACLGLQNARAINECLTEQVNAVLTEGDQLKAELLQVLPPAKQGDFNRAWAEGNFKITRQCGPNLLCRVSAMKAQNEKLRTFIDQTRTAAAAPPQSTLATALPAAPVQSPADAQGDAGEPPVAAQASAPAASSAPEATALTSPPTQSVPPPPASAPSALATAAAEPASSSGVVYPDPEPYVSSDDSSPTWTARLAKIGFIAAVVALAGLLFAGATNRVVIFYDWKDLLDTVLIFVSGFGIALVGLLFFSEDKLMLGVFGVAASAAVLYFSFKVMRSSLRHNKNAVVAVLIGLLKVLVAVFSIFFLLGKVSEVFSKNSSGGAKIWALLMALVFGWILSRLVNGPRVEAKRALINA